MRSLTDTNFSWEFIDSLMERIDEDILNHGQLTEVLSKELDRALTFYFWPCPQYTEEEKALQLERKRQREREENEEEEKKKVKLEEMKKKEALEEQRIKVIKFMFIDYS